MPSSSSSRKVSKSKKSDVTTQAADALAGLKQMTGNLTIDDSIPPNLLAATRISNRVPLEAMTIAVKILKDDPKRFPQFDGNEGQAAIDYEQQMGPVAQAALVLSKRITKSILKRRSNTAQQTLALYQVMKGTSRLSTDEETRTQVEQLKKLFTTYTKPRDTNVTQVETKKMVKTAKSAKKQAAAAAKAAEATNEAAIATAQAQLDAAVAAGTVSQLVAPAAAPSVPVTPAAPPVVAPATVAAAPLTPNH